MILCTLSNISMIWWIFVIISYTDWFNWWHKIKWIPHRITENANQAPFYFNFMLGEGELNWFDTHSIEQSTRKCNRKTRSIHMNPICRRCYPFPAINQAVVSPSLRWTDLRVQVSTSSNNKKAAAAATASKKITKTDINKTASKSLI